MNADVVEIRTDGGAVACLMPKLGGLVITTCAFAGEYGVAAIRPNVAWRSCFTASSGGSAAARRA